MRILDLRPAQRNTSLAMSDLLKRTLASFSQKDAATELVEVSVKQLESMAAKIADLEDRLATQSTGDRKLREHMKSMENQLRSHERTEKRISAKYKAALGDRGTYEHQRKLAEEKANKAQNLLDATKSDSDTLRKQVKDLESQLSESRAALESSANPDIAETARLERELQEARAKIQTVEKKVANAERDTDYSRKAYQDASNAHSLLSQENQELRERIEILERKARDNIVKINEINARNQDNAELRQTDELRAVLRDRERELSLARDELRHLKNGRRETRQASVPRSPRTTGVMSPRPTRGVGGGSRGTSPAPTHDGASVPGMAFLNRGHLRD